jgi:hypothetical protein
MFLKIKELMFWSVGERLAKLVGEGPDNRIAAGNEPVLGSQVDSFSFLGRMRTEKARFRTNDGHASTGPA